METTGCCMRMKMQPRQLMITRIPGGASESLLTIPGLRGPFMEGCV